MAEDLYFKVYVTDSLKGIYKSMGGEVRMRFFDIIEGKEIEETRTAEEIIDSIRDKLDEIAEV